MKYYFWIVTLVLTNITIIMFVKILDLLLVNNQFTTVKS